MSSVYKKLACHFFIFIITSVHGLFKSSRKQGECESVYPLNMSLRANMILYRHVSIIIRDAIKSNKIGPMIL